MTVRELCERMDSRELSEWMAYTRHFVALPDPWLQTGLVVAQLSAPYTDSKKGPPATASTFNPITKPPQHEEQDRAAVARLWRELGGDEQ